MCGGRGGSQHIHWRNLYSNGVQGGIAPIAVGMALAEKQRRTNAIVTVFLGDGTFGEGAIYEAFNMAKIWQAPILIVVEDNHIAQTTPTALTTAGSLADRLRAFDIPASELDTSDVAVIRQAAAGSAAEVRGGKGPAALVIHTARFGPHSKGDDTRTEQELDHLLQTRDPLKLLAGRLDLAAIDRVRVEVDAEVADAFQVALTHQFGDALDQRGLVDLVRQLVDDDAALATAHVLQVHPSADGQPAFAGGISLQNIFLIINNTTCRKVRSNNNFN